MPTMERKPVLDSAECNDCDACLEISPSVFKRMDSGIIWVADLENHRIVICELAAREASP